MVFTVGLGYSNFGGDLLLDPSTSVFEGRDPLLIARVVKSSGRWFGSGHDCRWLEYPCSQHIFNEGFLD